MEKLVWYIKAFDNKLFLQTEEELRHELEMLFDDNYFDGIEENMNDEPFQIMWQSFVKWIREKDFREWFKLDRPVTNDAVAVPFERQIYDDCSVGWCMMSCEDYEAIGEFEGW